MSQNPHLYAVVDVETTGGKPVDTKITEIAVYITDGKSIIEEYSTLVNPQRPIDWYVVKLTGITNELVAMEKPFAAVADNIKSLLDGKIFVAHNVDFDYNIIRREFLELGIPFESQKLCTVRAARKTFPGLGSYSLTNLTQFLNIPLAQAHRAADDAKATAELLHRILSEESERYIEQEIAAQNHIVQLPSHWTIYNAETPKSLSGIIYYHNQDRDIIYIESTANVRRTLYALLDDTRKLNPLEHKLRDHIHGLTIDYIAHPFKSELKALNDIQAQSPRYNKIMKPHTQSFVLHLKEDEHGMLYLNILKGNKIQEDIKGPLIYCNSFKNAEKLKHKIMHSQDLSSLPAQKKMILRLESEARHHLIEVYNQTLLNKIYKEYACPLQEGYYLMEIHRDYVAEVIYIQDHYLRAWGQARIEDNQVLDFSEEFRFDKNQKITRKFLNHLPGHSYTLLPVLDNV